MREIGQGIDKQGRRFTRITDGKDVYRAYEVEEWFGWETPATRQTRPMAGITHPSERQEATSTRDRLAHHPNNRG